MLTIKQVAARLNISVSTVRKLIEAGQLKAIRVGSQLRVTEAALSEYISNATL